MGGWKVLIRCLAYCGRQGRWVLPLGLIAGLLLPAAAQPMRAAIPWCIAVLLFLAGLPVVWLMAATLVSAAPPISGGPNLVLLLKGEGAQAMRWLMLGTAMLPLTCLPVLYLLFPQQASTTLLPKSAKSFVLQGGDG